MFQLLIYLLSSNNFSISNLVFSIAGLDQYHIYGAVFIAYIVIKEVFVLMKGENRQILNGVNELRLHLLDFKQAETPIKETLDLVKRQCQKEEDLQSHFKQSEEMYKWHNKEDSDGVKIWYVRSSLEDSFSKLASILERQEALLSRLVDRVYEMSSDVDKLKEKVK